MAVTMDDIAKKFKTMRFRKKLFGGVDEQDVWKQLADLQKAYRSAYEAQEIRCRTILEAHGLKMPEEQADETPEEK